MENKRTPPWRRTRLEIFKKVGRDSTMETIEADYVEMLIENTHTPITEVAEMLGMVVQNLRSDYKAFNIKRPRQRMGGDMRSFKVGFAEEKKKTRKTHKQCTICKKVKGILKHFGKKQNGEMGKSSICKKCVREVYGVDVKAAEAERIRKLLNAIPSPTKFERELYR